MALKLPINVFSWQSTLTRWATELRSQFFVDEQDFEKPERWDPVVAGTGTMGVSAYTVDVARSLRVGNMVWLTTRIISITTTGAGSPEISVSVPHAPDLNPEFTLYDFTFAARVSEGGATISGYAFFREDGNLKVCRYDGANWGIGVDRSIVTTGIYKARS